jgi:ATP-dependent helicase/nuclease subunit A
MGEKKMKWTDQQERAIRSRGSDVLVTASAGTGKTAVLSGRCADIASDIAAGASVSQMLVLTFTDAAAEQMEQRIREQLEARLLEEPGGRNLQMQLILLAGADIGTIHSFCRKIILEHFYALSGEGVDPAFRVIDDDEQQLLKMDALDKTLRWAWEDENLRDGMVSLFFKRDPKTESNFASNIILISEFLDNIPGRQGWYERATEFIEKYNPLTSPPGERQKEFIIGKIGGLAKQVRFVQKLCERYSSNGEWPAKWNDFVGILNHCIELHTKGRWEAVAEQIVTFEKPRINKPKDIDDTVAGYLQGIIKDAVDDFCSLRELAVLNPEYLDRMSGDVSIQTKVFIELVRKFDQFYRQAKQAAGGLDFADLEHYALKLLTAPDSESDEPRSSEVAVALGKRYKYIFVDEYQDINPVQESILRLISRPDNLFVVGDIKQSIYAFRGAEPKIFLKKLQPASANPKDGGKPLRVDLNINFRSGKGILDFVNIIFSNIMTGAFAGIDYDEGARLRPVQGKMTDEKGPLVELHIIEEGVGEGDVEQEQSDEPDEGVSVTSRQCQAALIAGRIRQMTGADGGGAEFQIYDPGQKCLRDVRYGDIAVLLRSPAKRVGDYVKILRLAGVPVSSSGAEGYFEAVEIADVLSLLKILDNPQRDIEFASVLRSPFFNFSDSDLAEIKIFAVDDSECRNFYDSVLRYAEGGPDSRLAGKLKDAIERLSRWRTDARLGKLSDLIWQIYRQTRYLSFVSALPSGAQRRANLLKLHDRAIQFENFASSGSFFSLARFVEFIEKLQATEAEWSFAEPESSTEDVVKITSIHKSKGLEYPVVILAELNGKFNTKDSCGDVIADAELTLGLRIIDQQSHTKKASLTHQVIAEQKLLTNLAEEMRILYVALTRARERLILVGSEKKTCCRQTILDGLFAEKPFDIRLISCRQNFLQWVLLGLSGQKILHKVFEIKSESAASAAGGADKSVTEGSDENLFSFRLYGGEKIAELTGYIERLRTGKFATGGAAAQPDTKGDNLIKADEIKRELNWKYEYEGVWLLPAKRTVSELSYANDEFKRADYSKSLERRPKAVVADTEEAVDSRQVGTAAHLLISSLDITRPLTAAYIEDVKKELVAEKIISVKIAERLDVSCVLKFFDSELGRQALERSNRVWREWPFTIRIPAGMRFGLELAAEGRQAGNDAGTGLQKIGAGETIIVQGIIDMLIRTGSGLVVIDFKTDNVTAAKAGERAGRYKFQLDLYSEAAEAVLQTAVSAKWVYFLKPGAAVQIR